MAVLAKALILALLSAASAADSADCGAEDATSLIQMKSTLEPGTQKKVISESLVDKVMRCANNCEDKIGVDVYTCHQECVEGVEEIADAEFDVRVVKIAEYCGDEFLESIMGLVARQECCQGKFPPLSNSIEYDTCTDVLKRIKGEKKVISESLVDKVMSCASNCEDKKGQENYIYECRQECLDGVKELAAAEQTARVVKVAEYCGDKYLENNMDLTAIFACCHDKFPKDGVRETDEYLKCKDVLQVIRKD